MPLVQIDQILNLLLEAKLCRKEGMRYILDQPLVHLDNKSPLISQHHVNWRLKAMGQIERNNEDEVHYSGTFTISKKDFSEVKNSLLNFWGIRNSSGSST